jgi:hypothetical protein
MKGSGTAQVDKLGISGGEAVGTGTVRCIHEIS